MEVVVMTEAIRRTKLQSKCQNQHPTLYRPDALPVTQATVSKHSLSISLSILTAIFQVNLGKPIPECL